MTAAQSLLIDAARRAPENAATVLDGLSPTAAHARPGGTQNPIAWLIWHAARQQDFQVAQLSGGTQVWTQADWSARTGIDRDAETIGFGDSAEQVEKFHTENLAALAEYLTATVEATVSYVNSLDDAALETVIDRSWDPPVTRGTRLVSTIEDTAQHLGQAAYARSLVQPDWTGPY